MTSSCSARDQQSSLGAGDRSFVGSRNGPEEQEPWGTPSGSRGALELAQTLPACLTCPYFTTRVFKNKNNKVEKPRTKQRCCLYPHIASFLYTVVFSEVAFMGLVLFPAVPALFSAHFHCSSVI